MEGKEGHALLATHSYSRIYGSRVRHVVVRCARCRSAPSRIRDVQWCARRYCPTLHVPCPCAPCAPCVAPGPTLTPTLPNNDERQRTCSGASQGNSGRFGTKGLSGHMRCKLHLASPHSPASARKSSRRPDSHERESGLHPMRAERAEQHLYAVPSRPRWLQPCPACHAASASARCRSAGHAAPERLNALRPAPTSGAPPCRRAQ